MEELGRPAKSSCPAGAENQQPSRLAIRRAAPRIEAKLGAHGLSGAVLGARLASGR